MNFNLNFEDMDILEMFNSDSEEFETYLSKVSDEELKENIPNANIPQPDQQAEPSAKRFKSVTEEEMKILFDSRQAKATQRNTAWGMKIFQEWNMEVFGECINMNTVAVSNLAACLSRFYCEARPQAKSQGEENPLYHKNTLINIRAAINRHLADIRRDINIVKDKEFRTANGILDGLFKERTRLGLSKPITHKQIIERQDLEKIYQYFQCGALKSPVVLRQAVWYFLAIHFVTRGLEFHHQLRIDSFEFSSDGTGEFASLRHETLQKNHQGGLSSTDCHTDKRMYASGTDCCPVRMLKNLIERTDKEATHLFNQYIKDRVLDPHTWFSSKPLQKRTFSSFLADICKAAGVEKRYTPHCLRATAISFLNDHGFEARHIMFMSNHRNESSIRSYNRSLSTNQKKSISASLTSMASASSVSSVDSQTALALPPSSAASTPCPTLDLVPSVSSPGDSMMSATTSATFNMQNINPSTGFFHQASFNNCVFHFK